MPKQAGFTFVELIVAFTLTAIFAGILMLRWPSQKIDVNMYAQRLANDIRYIKSLSIARGERFRLAFSSNSYQLTDRQGTAIQHPILGTATVTLATGLSFSAAPSQLLFDGRGVPYTNSGVGSSPASSDLTITLSASGQTQSVVVRAYTGLVE